MRRAPLTLILVVGLVIGSVAAVAAAPTKDTPRAGSPAASHPTATQPLDLAAMVLRPADMPSPDFGIGQSYRYGIDLYDGATRQSLQDADWQAGYEVALGQSNPGSSYAQFMVQSALDVFAEPKGAATGLHVFADHIPSGFDYVKGTRTIGDESSINGGHQIDPDGRPRQELTLVFRFDRVVGTIYVDDYTGKKPSVATIETLGDKFLARVKAGLAGTGPGLGHRIVALVDVGAYLTVTDSYWRLDGRWVPIYDDTPATIKSRARYYQGATDLYALLQDTSNNADAPAVIWRLATFPTTSAAGNWTKSYFPLSQKDPDEPWTITPQTGRTFGDAGFTQTISYTYPAQNEPDGKKYGVAIIARFGTIGAVLKIEGGSPVPLAAAETLMTTEAGCINAATPCPTVPVPLALTSA